ncbi:restriction endonuclease [Flaviflexus salsibiostraticola]|uniref:site-specific DNA-methyltransferase (adenine-specific) n=1 Tax=Flaviflexus salsibiostraticola TaxID=1282737 RepID=A0A3Q8WUM9_9ACTO|nr:Eco57I restriction-modification methylase domain-containing protein [Flaviflexus salsibiostraticola]AZN30720.1 restriction endonuclease [Flaviflexus salsibiostraticola]
MTVQTSFSIRGRNPDVLTCIANLSNDEVFTPPELANQMLDMVAEAWAGAHDGENIWENPTVRFLDPVTKSGVFLREITSRLTTGLVDQIPDLQERVDHILAEQVFGIAITHLTSLLSRRSLYCSKYANSKHSIATSFDDPDGNIWFERLEHTFEGGNEWIYATDSDGNQIEKRINGKCKFCGAPQKIFDRDDALETHAYALLHAQDIKTRVAELFGEDMQFDVIIGNPPYQMTGGAGGSSDSSIYHLFVEQAQKLEPRFLSMVIPSRWMAGGRGLGDFRQEVLTSRKLKELVDWGDSTEAFPGVSIKGGICYFLWEKDYEGPCDVTRVSGGKEFHQGPRDLGEFDVFIRDERALSILRKILPDMTEPVSTLVSGDTPFGIATNFGDFHTSKRDGDLLLHRIEKGKRSTAYVNGQVLWCGVTFRGWVRR